MTTPTTPENPVTEVTITKLVVSSVPGRVGSWTILKKLELPRVPVAGDEICHHDDWGCETVERVILSHDGYVEAHLVPMRTDSPARLDETELLVAEHGWDRHGGPWRAPDSPRP